MRFVERDPDVSRTLPKPGDAFVILASDGLWWVVSLLRNRALSISVAWAIFTSCVRVYTRLDAVSSW